MTVEVSSPCDVRSEMATLVGSIQVQMLAAMEDVARESPPTMAKAVIAEKLRSAINKRLGKSYIAASSHVVLVHTKTAT